MYVDNKTPHMNVGVLLKQTLSTKRGIPDVSSTKGKASFRIKVCPPQVVRKPLAIGKRGSAYCFRVARNNSLKIIEDAVVTGNSVSDTNNCIVALPAISDDK